MRRILNDLKIMLLANLWIVPVLGALVFGLFYFVAPPPPMSATLATGSAGGGYHAFGVKLKDALAKEGFTLRLAPSGGSLDNLDQLATGQVQLALVQGGQELSLPAKQRRQLVGLGVMYQEPLWLFTRRDVPFATVLDLLPLRVAVGTASSGSGVVVRDLLRAYD